jgi:rRNA-processing protein FCF1
MDLEVIDTQIMKMPIQQTMAVITAVTRIIQIQPIITVICDTGINGEI